jgi:hypothetical protein
MGDMAEVFNDLKQIKKEKRASNTQASTEILKAEGITFQANNGGAHLVVAGKGLIDFWPSTGLWIARSGRKGRGVRNLIKFLKSKDAK